MTRPFRTNPNPASRAACHPLLGLALALALAPSPANAEPRNTEGPAAEHAVEAPQPAPQEAVTSQLAYERDQRAVRRAFSLSTGVAGAGLLVGGLVLWNQGRTEFASALPGLDQPVLPLPAGQDRYYAVDRLTFHTRSQWVGLSLAAGGLGVGVVSLTEALGAGKRALITELSLGAAFTGAGVLGVQLLKQKHQIWAQVTQNELERRRDVITPFYALLGAGVGLATTALSALIIRRALEHRQTRRPTIAHHGATIHF